MRRRLFNIVATLSLLMSLAMIVAWAMSYARPGWRLIGTAHSADLTRVNGEPRTALFITTANWSKESHHGFWDALWARSHSGRLTLLAQTIDYDGTLKRVHVSPPSLIVDLPGQGHPQAIVFGSMSDSVPPPSSLGFAWHTDGQAVDGVSARARMVTLPWWFIVLLFLVLPLLRLRVARRRR